MISREMTADAVRLATAGDLLRIGTVIERAYAPYVGRLDRPPAPMVRDYAATVDQGLVWVTGDPIDGLISMTTADGSLLVENVAVDPARQGRGIGRRLLTFAEDEAKRRRLHRLTLYTNEAMTENLLLYAHLGYREVRRATEDGYRRVFMEKLLPLEPE